MNDAEVNPPMTAPPESAPPETARVGSWTPNGAAPPPPGEDAVIAACQTVYDPEIPVSVYELGLIYAIGIEPGGRVKVEMTLTAPGCPSAQELPVQIRDAIMAVEGVTYCDVDVVWDPPWHPGRMTEDARLVLNMF